MRRPRAEPPAAASMVPADGDERVTQVLLAARADPRRLGEFFSLQYPTVLRSFARVAICPEIAADLAAETFAVVVRDLHRFDATRGSASAWVSAIARRQLRTWVRRGVVDARARQRLRITTPAFVDDASPHAGLDDAPLRAAIRDALRSLPDADQRVIHLRVVDGLPYGEVANALGCTEGAARVRSSRALARLRAVADGEPARVAGLA